MMPDNDRHHIFDLIESSGGSWVKGRGIAIELRIIGDLLREMSG